MKTLILNGSPRPRGDSAALIAALKAKLDGEIVELSAYRNKISPCIDCRYCYTHAGCSIRDDMQVVYDDDFDNIVIASPVHYGLLSAGLLSLASRLQLHHTAKHMRGEPIVLRPKRGAVMLVGGGKGRPNEAKRLSRVILRILNAALDDDALEVSGNGIFAASLNTDAISAAEDTAVMDAVSEIAKRLNAPAARN